MLVMPFNDPMHGALVPSFGGPWAKFLGVEKIRDFPRVGAGLPLLEYHKECLELLGVAKRAAALVLEPVW